MEAARWESCRSFLERDSFGKSSVLGMSGNYCCTRHKSSFVPDEIIMSWKLIMIGMLADSLRENYLELQVCDVAFYITRTGA